MTKAVRFLEDTVLADVAFEATGDSLDEVFEAATQATIELMADPGTVFSDWHQDVDLSEEDVAALLFEWLSHLVFVKDAKGVVFHKAPLTVGFDKRRNRWFLHGTLIGECINQATQTLRADVKAVTKHQYFLKEENGKWVARIVLDL